jgi:hypothetical protein
MDPNGDGDIPGGDHLGDQDREALLTLERSVRGPGLVGLWRRIKFRVLVAWGARLAIWGGLIICVAALVTMWEELGTHVEVAVAGEVILTAGALWLAPGLRLWWHWGRAKRQPGR